MAYRTTRRVIARKKDRRRRILGATRQLIAEGGFAAVQIASVAYSAGIATGTIYRYFPSRAELVAEVFRVISQREVDVMTAVAASDGSAAQRLKDAITTFSIRAIAARRLAYALIFEPIDPLIIAERHVFRRSYAAVMSGLLDEGIADGEFPDQPSDIVANCLVGAMAEALAGPLAPDAAAPDENRTATETIVQFCLKAVR